MSEEVMIKLTPETALAMAACNGAKTPKFYARFPYIGTETELSQAKEMIAALSLLGFEVRRKGCPIAHVYCGEHGFVHGTEAEELRSGIEKLTADAEEVSADCLLKLLDEVDARDSLAFCESRVMADSDTWRARAEKAEKALADYEQTIIWHTCCPMDARRLSQLRDAEERAERAEETVRVWLERPVKRRRCCPDSALLLDEVVELQARATQAEAQAAAMRKLVADVGLGELPDGVVTDYGRTLLAELEALRALYDLIRTSYTPQETAVVEAVERIAAVDAARKGE